MEQIEIRRNVRVALAIAVVAVIVAALFLARGGGWLVLGVLLLALGGFYAWVAYDGRVPLMIVDEQGVRARRGSAWRGVPWSQVREIEHTPVPRGVRGWWREGRLVVLPQDDEPLTQPLGLATMTLGHNGDLAGSLALLAPAETTIVEIDESLAPVETGEQPVVPEARTAVDETDETGAESDGTERGSDVDEGESDHTSVRLPRVAPEQVPERAPETSEAPDTSEAAVAPVAPEPTVASPTPAPLREPTQVVRVDVDLERSAPAVDETAAAPSVPADPEDLTPESPESPESPEEAGIAPTAPVIDPVIGPELRGARERLGLSIDQLAQRTRIRPHVIEAMEVDDFGPCGGDFYARGHLRTLARVIGLDAAPLLAGYDERYADAPVDPRAVFRADLAHSDGGSLRRLNSGSNWSVLVAAVMVVVLTWSVVRLVTAGSTTPKAGRSMTLQSSTYAKDPYGKVAAPVPVTLDAAGGGAHVIVRDASNKVVFSGDLAFGQSKRLRVSPPLRITSSDGSLAVAVDGHPASAIGRTGHFAQHTYTAQ